MVSGTLGTHGTAFTRYRYNLVWLSISLRWGCLQLVRAHWKHIMKGWIPFGSKDGHSIDWGSHLPQSKIRRFRLRWLFRDRSSMISISARVGESLLFLSCDSRLWNNVKEERLQRIYVSWVLLLQLLNISEINSLSPWNLLTPEIHKVTHYCCSSIFFLILNPLTWRNNSIEFDVDHEYGKGTSCLLHGDGRRGPLFKSILFMDNNSFIISLPIKCLKRSPSRTPHTASVTQLG